MFRISLCALVVFAGCDSSTVSGPDASGPSGCTADRECADQFSETRDLCSLAGPVGTCQHWPDACFGARSRIPASATRCQSWSGFNLPPGTAAPKIFDGSPSALSDMPGEPGFKRLPANGCSMQCYDNAGNRVQLLTRVQWYHGASGFGECMGTTATWDCLNIHQ